MATASPLASHLAAVDTVIAAVVAPRAQELDRTGAFPRAAVAALGEAGLLGLISAKEVGGMGLGHRAAVEVVERLAQACASTAMVTCMHYCGAAVIEAHGDMETRRAIAAGKHLTTLAFSEAGSRSHFWAPVSTARAEGEGVVLDAQKSWVTSAGEADSYVWSSAPVAADGASSIWLVDARAPGLAIPAPFDGMGLRGNASAPITATAVRVALAARLGPDGGGFDVMMGIVLPYFCLMNAACSVGTMEAATERAAAHCGQTRFQHLGSALAELPTIRAYVARMRLKTDMAAGLIAATLAALEGGAPETMLRVLEVKAGAAEAALEVTELGMRVCGGAAFRKEVGLERNFRDARAASVMAPTTDVLYDFIGKAACGLPLFG